jgi:hypothetical protein
LFGGADAPAAPAGAERVDQQRHRVFRIGGEQQVDRREALMVHAPAIVDLVVDRDADHLGVRGRSLRGFQGAGEIDPVEAEDEIGLAERREAFSIRRQHRRRAEMLRVIGREARADLQVGDDARADRSRQVYARSPRGFAARSTPDQHHDVLRGLQQRGGLRHMLGGGRARDRRREARRSSGASGSASFASCISASRLT